MDKGVVQDIGVDPDKQSQQYFKEININPLSSFADLIFNSDQKTLDNNISRILKDTEQARQKLQKTVVLPNLKFLTEKQQIVILSKMLGISERTIAKCMGLKSHSSVRSHIYGTRNEGGALRSIIKHWLKTPQNSLPKNRPLQKKLNLSKKTLYIISDLFFRSPYSKKSAN